MMVLYWYLVYEKSISIVAFMSASTFLVDEHRRYFASALHSVPAPYSKLDSNRLTLTHFAVHALDLLQVWDDPRLVQKYNLDRSRIIEWIYSLYLPTSGGFQGGSYAPVPHHPNNNKDDGAKEDYRQSHIAMTYTATCTLVTLGDDLTKLDKNLVIRQLRRLQRPDGSFQCTNSPSESDMRFLYCACAISTTLNDWSGIDVDLAVRYIQSCRSVDGAIALVAGQVSI
jgi:geranylgeranyl transferase type-1 subunit beta